MPELHSSSYLLRVGLDAFLTEIITDLRSESRPLRLMPDEIEHIREELRRLKAEVADGLERERDYRARMIAVGSLICLPVSERNLSDAKELLVPAYHDAARDLVRRKTSACAPEAGPKTVPDRTQTVHETETARRSESERAGIEGV